MTTMTPSVTPTAVNGVFVSSVMADDVRLAATFKTVCIMYIIVI